MAASLDPRPRALSGLVKADKEVVLKAVASKGLALQFAHPSLREDREVVDVAVANDPDAVQFEVRRQFPRLEEAERMVCYNRECANFGGIEYGIDRCSHCDRKMEKNLLDVVQRMSRCS